MDISNEVLEDMQKRKFNYNRQYANWYMAMSEEFKDELVAYSERLKGRADRISCCLNLWQWDMYRKNKLMDLQRVNRCLNNRFCPNCRKWDLVGAIHNLRKPLNKLLLEGYYPYLVTLTVPNVDGKELRRTIEKMNKTFRKLFGAYSYSLIGNTKGFQDRLMEFQGALKVLEITYNAESNTYHPHFHCMFFSMDYDESLFVKETPGEWSNKRQSYNFYSDIDFQIMKLWTMYYKGIRLNVNNYSNFQLGDCYLCDIREMDSSGIVEVLKYTFKDTDIVSYDVFKNLVIALDKKRIRQGYGLLYNLKLEGDAEGEVLSLEDYLTEEEEPENLLTHEIRELLTDYKEYRKISRRKADEELELIKES